MLPLFHSPAQQKIIIAALPESLECWWKLIDDSNNALDQISSGENSNGGAGQLRDGIFVPSSVIRSEKMEKKATHRSRHLVALSRLVDVIVTILEMSEDEETVEMIARSVQTIVLRIGKSVLQKVFVRFADVLVGWTTRNETHPERRYVMIIYIYGICRKNIDE